MTYLLDGRPLQDGSRFRGIGTYLRGLLEGYAALGLRDEVSLMLARDAPVPEEAVALGIGIAGARVPRLKRRLQPLLDPFVVSRAISATRPALYHGIDYGQPIHSRVPIVITVHDLIPFVFPHLYPWQRRERLLALRLLHRAQALIAISQSAAGDLVRIAGADPRRISVIPLGVSAGLGPAAPEAVAAVRRRLALKRPFLLAVGTFDPRKRIDATIAVLARLRATHDLDLVIAGSQGNFDASVTTAIAGAGVESHCHRVGFVSPADLAALYSATSCLVFTSAYEGFGLPPLEALACGAPVAVFANSSLVEVAGPAALVCSDGDVAAMASAIAGLLSDPADRAARQTRGREWARSFTWEQTARQTIDVYRRVLAGRQPKANSAPLRG